MLELLKEIITNGLGAVLIGRYEFLQGNASYFILISSMLLCIIIPYILGSINFALILSKKEYHDDIRLHGSGNAGFTNMFRTYGKKAAKKTFAGDALKAFVACIIGYFFLGYIGCYLAGLFCVVGHAFPVFYKFKGGKGVTVVAVSILMGNPIVFLIMFIIFAIIVLSTKFVSLASIICLMMYPLVLNGVQTVLSAPIVGEELAGGTIEVPIALCTAILIIFLHRSNIKRLLAGTENKTYLFSKNKQAPAIETQEEPEIEEQPKMRSGKHNPNTSKKKIKRKNKKN